MWRRIAVGLLPIALAAAPASAARSRAAAEDLLRIAAPTSLSTASAHPHVNVIVSFGTTRDGTPVDPSTFRAKLNGRDATSAFLAVFEGGVQTGVRAALQPGWIRFAAGPRNRLRLVAQATRGGKGPRARDLDRVRFGAAEAANQPPVVALAADAEAAVVGQPIGFDASGSHDPDADELGFAWTFSDGATATGPVVSHAFASAAGAAVSATVTVSDGVTSVPASVTLPAALTPDPGRTAGMLRIEAATALEFSAVALGSTATRSLTVVNTDTAPTSQIKLQAVVEGAPAFTAPPAPIDLGPGASATIDVVFAPSAAGHAGATVLLTTSASNRGAVSFLAHGHGGAAPGDGPTLLAVPVFGVLGGEIARLAPEGGRVAVENSIGSCGPPAAIGTGDACVVNGDCTTGGEVCAPSGAVLDASALCSDGASLYVLSEDTYVDPRLDPDTELSGTLVRFDLDAAGATVGKAVLYRATEDTTQLACDGVPAGGGGLVYLAEFRNVVDTENCSRDEREALVSINKGTGNARTLPGFSRLDEAAGIPECEFRDGVERLAVSPDGARKYASYETRGLWRIAPTPLPFSPDVHQNFALHPDGSVVVATTRDRGATGSVELYRLTEAQVQHGALPLSALTPCASFDLPNNTTAAEPTTTLLGSIVVGPSSPGGLDATALVTFRARATVAQPDLLPPFGELRGTVAFSLPAGAATCAVAGLVSLEGRELAK
jgi:hypothetical protein